MAITSLRAQLYRDEGVRLMPYRDSEGLLTIGVGRCLERVGISMGESELMLDNDISRASAAVLAHIPWSDELDEIRREALINLAFNVGIKGLLGFKKMLAALERRGARRDAGVFHSFTEDATYGAKAIALGYLVSFSGMITFRAADNIRSAAAGLPLEAMLVETDTPYLAPVPHRGKPCEPAYVVETAKELARVKGVSQAEIARITTDNFFRLYAKTPRTALAA